MKLLTRLAIVSLLAGVSGLGPNHPGADKHQLITSDTGSNARGAGSQLRTERCAFPSAPRRDGLRAEPGERIRAEPQRDERSQLYCCAQ